ncbi:MAG: NAD(P)/FAD-dependent oxidoreductase, partial [Pirellulales bacterium]
MPDNGTTADVIIVGAGVAGASTAMQLALRGARVLVLERQLLGAGSTGRAAGLLGQLRSTRAATTLLRDGLKIVRDVERRTGLE